MKFIYKMSDTYDVHIQNNWSKVLHVLRSYHDMTLAANDAAVYTRYIMFTTPLKAFFYSYSS